MSVPRRDTNRSNQSAESGQTGISRSSTTSSGSTTYSELMRRNPQCIQDRYVKRAKLEKYLEGKFPGQWEVHVSCDDGRSRLCDFSGCTDDYVATA